MKTYTILGANCCFAQHTAVHLLELLKTETVLGIGRNAPSWSHRINVGPRDRYRYAVQDIRQTEELFALLRSIKPHVIINFAAEGESGGSFVNSAKYFDTNCTALARLVEKLALEAPWLQRFVQISSGEVYGSTNVPAYEDDALAPTSPYAASKAAADHYLMAMHRRRGFPVNIVRPSNVYGEGQQLYRIVPKAIMFALTQRKLPLYGNGLGEKSYLHVSDMARGIVTVATRAPLGRIYNLSPREPISIRDMVEKIAEVMDVPSIYLYEDKGIRRGTDSRYWLDSRAMEYEFKWKPQMPLDDGLRFMRAWHMDNLETCKAMLDGEIARQPVPQPIGV